MLKRHGWNVDGTPKFPSNNFYTDVRYLENKIYVKVDGRKGSHFYVDVQCRSNELIYGIDCDKLIYHNARLTYYYVNEHNLLINFRIRCFRTFLKENILKTYQEYKIIEKNTISVILMIRCLKESLFEDVLNIIIKNIIDEHIFEYTDRVFKRSDYF
jgi:hypothetical protein